ncbi:alkaline phosphatase [Paracoccaceae bacterium GXU_MW_L88]
MLRFTSACALLLAGAASAQTAVNQESSAWYTDAQALLEEKLAHENNTNTAKNVILFVADGNGVGTNYATRLWVGQQEGGLGDDYVLPQEEFPNMALVKTYTTNGQTPDSAPTASALNTGVKSKNGMINVSEDVALSDCANYDGNTLTTFAEIATDQGKSVGIVSTARITHATPAAVYSKTLNRDWENDTEMPEGECQQTEDIAAQLITAMEAGTVDFVMGGGRRNFLPNGVTDDEGGEGLRLDDRNLVEEAQELGWQYVWNDETAAAADPGQPVFGLFEASHMQYEHDREGEPSVAEMTEMAINSLQNNEDGYFLQVESGRVDHANHDGNLYRTVTDGAAFAEAIAKAVEMTNPEETLIIVTADHSHAINFNGYCGRGSNIVGLCMQVDDEGTEHNGEPNMALDGKPYTVAGYLNGAGSVMVQEEGANDYSGSRPELTEEEATDPDYLQQSLIPMTSETHSGEDITAMATGPWSHLVDGVIEQNFLFHVMNYAISGGEEMASGDAEAEGEMAAEEAASEEAPAEDAAAEEGETATQ